MPKRIAQILGKMDNGGIESVVMNYYKLIDKSQVQFDFYVDKNSSIPQKAEILKRGGKIFYLPSYTNPISYCIILQKYLNEGNYTIVHAHMSTMSVLPLYIAKKVGIPVRIAHSHSTANLYEFKKSILKYLLRPFAKVYATDYVACGEKAGRWLFSNKTFDNGEVFIMENIINYNKFKFNQNYKNEILAEFNIPHDSLVIGHIGRFCKQKNQLYLLDIFAKILKQTKNAKLILVGEGGDYLDKVREKSDNLKITNSIIFTGVRYDIEKFYSAFDIFLLPSLYEGLPVVSVEAKANGLPMIVSNRVTSEIELTSININKASITQWCVKALQLARE